MIVWKWCWPGHQEFDECHRRSLEFMGTVGHGPAASRIFIDVVTNGEGDLRDCRDATSVPARCDSRSNQRVANFPVAEGCLGHSWNINLRLSTLIKMNQFQSRVVRERGASQIFLRGRSRLMRLAPLIVVVALASSLFGDRKSVV